MLGLPIRTVSGIVDLSHSPRVGRLAGDRTFAQARGPAGRGLPETSVRPQRRARICRVEDRDMPVRNRGRLLAGAGVLLGLLLPCVGCQTQPTNDGSTGWRASLGGKTWVLPAFRARTATSETQTGWNGAATTDTHASTPPSPPPCGWGRRPGSGTPPSAPGAGPGTPSVAGCSAWRPCWPPRRPPSARCGRPGRTAG